MNAQEMIARLIDANNMIASALTDLHADPALVDNPHFRENLGMTGYQIGTLLSDED